MNYFEPITKGKPRKALSQKEIDERIKALDTENLSLQQIGSKVGASGARIINALARKRGFKLP
ncbi:MAG: hypothetical protein ACYSUX_14280 [Planctomycetota bacterium]|jgi:hypothetical protein